MHNQHAGISHTKVLIPRCAPALLLKPVRQDLTSRREHHAKHQGYRAQHQNNIFHTQQITALTINERRPPLSRPNLTPKQAAFVAEYLIDLNAAAAARRAGYSERTADRTGYENLRKPEIAAAIAEAQAERSERTKLTADDVVAGLHREATYFDEGSSHSARVAAWAHLGKHLGMFTDRVDVTTKGDALNVPVQVYLPSNGRDERA